MRAMRLNKPSPAARSERDHALACRFRARGQPSVAIRIRFRSVSSAPPSSPTASALAHHDNPVADIDELLGVGRGEQDARARLRASSDQMRLISRRAPTSTPRVGIDHDEDAGLRSEPAGDLHLLLIAA